MMNTAKARDLLEKVAQDCGNETTAAAIRSICEEHLRKRSSAKPRARVKQAKITSDLVSAVLAASRENPHLHNRDVGRHFGIDGGRVSEILQGDRTVDFPEGTPEFRERNKS